jgi:phosphoglycolate phosphatase-like HAD superfamily hydrolase
MKDISLAVFDLDGTLINAYPAIYHSFNFAMRKAGYPPQKEQVICRAVGWGDQNLIRPFVKPEDLERVLAVYRRDHAKSLKERGTSVSRGQAPPADAQAARVQTRCGEQPADPVFADTAAPP